MNWVAKFFLSGCEFQDLFSRRMIDNVKKCVGLYFLEENQVNVNKEAQALSGESIFVYTSNQIMLWYNRFGYPNFSYLQKLFPSLFKKKDINSFLM